MQQIPLTNIPRQQFTVIINSHTYTIRVYDVGQPNTVQMYADISIDSNAVVTGIACLHGSLLIPQPSQTLGNGNFLFIDSQQGNIDWNNFGNQTTGAPTTCWLYYAAPTGVGNGLS